MQNGHKHTYDTNGKASCCDVEDKIYTNANQLLTPHTHQHHHDHSHGHGHEHSHGGEMGLRIFLPAIVSAVILVSALILDHWLKPNWFSELSRTIIYILAYLPVGIPVMKEAWESIKHKDIFSEFFLMVVATIGAFAIGEYPEAVAVMLFYTIGEVFQTLAVKRAKSDIKNLLDQRPDEVTILENGQEKKVKAKNVNIDSIIQLKPGEKLALDAELISDSAIFNTAALTGESQPDYKEKGATVLAGMINLQSPAQVKVTTAYQDSKLSKILTLVQEATAHKAPTELFIRKFARIYTPIVVFAAIAICLLPYFFVADYSFKDWLYRSLIFLVISCPCALVISIPLGYFGGIGAASKHGILFKGSHYLDVMAKINHVVTDKTGTMTEGVFRVQKVVFNPDFEQQEILKMVNALENISTHPIASAIRDYVGEVDKSILLEEVEEIDGHGLKAEIDGKTLLAGNYKLLRKFNIDFQEDTNNKAFTLIAIAYNHQYVGYIAVADQIKTESDQAVQSLSNMGVQTTMLSGDKASVVAAVAQTLGIKNYFSELLPEDKVDKIKALKAQNRTVAFVGDGINDAPAIALSDVGIAMGGLGSDAAIETAEVVIQDDNPLKIPMAIEIGKQTKKIVWQNISFAFGIKVLVLILGAGGVATMWEAVFADVGVALVAVFNAIRIQKMNFSK